MWFLLLLLIPTQADLQRQADSYLHLFDNMPSRRIVVLPDSDFQRTCEPKYPRQPACASYSGTIYFTQSYIEGKGDPRPLEDILKHELIHEWIFWKGLKEDDSHGLIFKAKERELGLDQQQKVQNVESGSDWYVPLIMIPSMLGIYLGGMLIFGSIHDWVQKMRGETGESNVVMFLIILGAICVAIGLYLVFGVGLTSGSSEVVYGGSEEGVSLGYIEPGQTIEVTHLDGKIISNTQTGWSSPIWGVPQEETLPQWVVGLPYKEMWTDAIFVRVGGQRVPFRKGQTNLSVTNTTGRRQEARLMMNDSRYWENKGNARFSFEVR